MTQPKDLKALDRSGVKMRASLVGRDEELGILMRCIDEAVKGHGGTILLEGEAGIGKSRLISEVRGYAEGNGARLLVGRGLEGASPFMPFVNALKDVGPDLITPGELSVIEEVFLVNDRGMLIAHAARTLRPEVDEMTVGRVFATIKDFMSRSFEGKVGEGELDELQYGSYKILFDSAPPINLAVVVSGGVSKDLKESMRSLVTTLGKDYGPSLKNWKAGMSVPRRLETDLAMFATLEFRAERRLDTIDPKREQDRMFDSVLGAILAISRVRPVVLVIDDMQWMDDSSLDLFHYISRNIRNARVLMIGAYRPEEGMDPATKRPLRLMETLGRMGREKLYISIVLRRLKEAETRRMVASIFPRNDFPERFLDRIFKDTEGNPFFVEEILDSLVLDEALASEKDGVWHIKEEMVHALPSTIKDVVLRRIDRLEENYRKVLETAAVVGTEFNIDVLRTVLEADEEELLVALDELAGMRLLREVPGGEYYTFDHGVIREVLYENMGRNLRRMIHRRVAEVLERMFTEDPDSVVYDLARHYGMTKEHEKALYYSVRAARRAMRLFALKEAREYFSDAVGQLSEVKDLTTLGLGSRISVEVNLLNEAANASWHVGDYEQAKRYTTRVLELAPTEGLYNEMARTYLLRGTVAEIKGEREEAVLDLEAAVELSERIGDQKGKLEAIHILGRLHWRLANYDKALEYLNECIRGSERINEAPLLANALITKGNVYNVRGDFDEAINLYERGLTIAKDHNSTYELMRAYNNLGDLNMDRNELDTAEDYFMKCLDVAERSGDQRFVGYSQSNLGEIHIKRGDFAKAKIFSTRALEIFTRLDEKAMVAAVYDDFGVIYTSEKNWTEATVCFEIAISALETLQQPHPLARAHYDCALMLKEKGDRVAAVSQFEAALEIYKKAGSAGMSKTIELELAGLRTGVEPTRVNIVGRERPLAELQYLLEVGTGIAPPERTEAPQGVKPVKRSGLFVLLEGGQGMGKSRVVEEVMALARKRNVTIIVGRCLRTETSNPYFPFIQALTELFKGKDQASLRRFMRRAPLEVLAVLPGMGGIGIRPDEGLVAARADQGTTGGPGTDGDEGKVTDLGAMKDRMFEVLSRLLLEFDEPVALILEDLHYADVSSLQVLAYIAREMEGSKTFILASYSPDAIVQGNSFADNLKVLDKEPTVHTIELENLEPAQVRELIFRFLRVQDIPMSFAEGVHRRTKGNPMFVEELLKVLPKGMTTEELSRFDLDKVHVPGTVSELIAGLLSRLSPEEREMLEYAAVAGSTFRSRMLFETMGLGQDAERTKEINGILEGLETKMYLRAVDENVLSFVHPMVQQVVYETVPLERRRNLHKAFGRSWERLGKDDLEAVAFDLAYHFGRGGADDKAFRYLMLAGQRAEAMSAPREAETFFRDALRCADSMRMNRGEESTISVGEVLAARHHLDQALVAQGKLDEAMEVSRVTLSVARDVGDINREAQALMDIGEITSIRSSWDDAWSAFDRARALCEESGFKRGLFRAYKGLAWISWRRGEFEKAHVHAAECVKLANELDDKHLLAQAYMEMAAAHGEKGENEEAIEVASKARAIFEAAGDKAALARAHNNLGVAYREKGDPVGAMSHFEKSIAISREIGGIRMMGYAMTNLSECHLLIGNLEKAYDICQKALAIFLKLDEPFMVSSCYRRLGMIERKRGRYEASEAHILKAISMMALLDSPGHHAESHYELGLLYIDMGKLDKAKEELAAAVGLFKRIGIKPGQEKSLKVLAELVKMMGKGLVTGVGPGDQDKGQ